MLWGQDSAGQVVAVSTFDVPRDGVDVLPGLPLQAPVAEMSAPMVTQELGSTAPAQAPVAGSV